MLVVRSDNDTIKSFADLKGRKSAQSLTSNFSKLASSHGAEIVPTDGFNQSLELVLSGRAEATLNDNLSYLDFKNRNRMPKSKWQQPLLKVTLLVLWYAKTSRNWLLH